MGPSRIFEKLLSPAGKVRASFKISPQKPFYSSKKLSFTCTFEFKSTDKTALQWTRKMLHQHQSTFKNGVFLHVKAEHRVLLPDLSRLGSHVHSVVFGGKPRTALRGLQKKYGKLDWTDLTSALEVVPLRTSSQVREVIGILKAEFSRCPEYGWFVASPEYLSHEAKQLNRQRKKRQVMNYVIIKDCRVVGEYGFELSMRKGKRHASLALNFAKEIQGKGYSKIAYQHILKRMIDMKIEEFTGGTSQKSVIKLARVMNRPLLSYYLAPGKRYFPRAYFP